MRRYKTKRMRIWPRLKKQKLAAYRAKIKEANAARDQATDGNKIQRAINLCERRMK